jgi:hypothetical protein
MSINLCEIACTAMALQAIHISSERPASPASSDDDDGGHAEMVLARFLSLPFLIVRNSLGKKAIC